MPRDQLDVIIELIISHLDNAIVDHMVPHDRSISRNVPQRPNGLRNNVLKI